LKAKRVSAPMRPLSPASSARGRLVMGRGAVIGASRQRAPNSPRATASNGPTCALMLPPETGAFLTLPRRHPREVTMHVVPAAVLYAGPAVAQNGRISGVVRGAGGVAASGAVVRATNQATGATSRTTTAADGSYTDSNLAPGAYTVAASLLGQRAASQKDVRVAAGAAVSLDLVLQPLTLEAITVTAMLREQ